MDLIRYAFSRDIMIAGLGIILEMGLRRCGKNHFSVVQAIDAAGLDWTW